MEISDKPRIVHYQSEPEVHPSDTKSIQQEAITSSQPIDTVVKEHSGTSTLMPNPQDGLQPPVTQSATRANTVNLPADYRVAHQALSEFTQARIKSPGEFVEYLTRKADELHIPTPGDVAQLEGSVYDCLQSDFADSYPPGLKRVSLADPEAKNSPRIAISAPAEFNLGMQTESMSAVLGQLLDTDSQSTTDFPYRFTAQGSCTTEQFEQFAQNYLEGAYQGYVEHYKQNNKGGCAVTSDVIVELLKQEGIAAGGMSMAVYTGLQDHPDCSLRQVHRAVVVEIENQKYILDATYDQFGGENLSNGPQTGVVMFPYSEENMMRVYGQHEVLFVNERIMSLQGERQKIHDTIADY